MFFLLNGDLQRILVQTIIFIDKLVDISFSNVIGHKLAKKGLLLSLVNSSLDAIGNRKRIHVLAIGNPGLAKSTLLRSACQLEANVNLFELIHSLYN